MTNAPASERPATLVRTVSFVAALAASLTRMLFPFLLRYVPDGRLHAALPVALLGIAGAFVYGIGYRPDTKALRILFGPICAWSLIVLGALMVVAR